MGQRVSDEFSQLMGGLRSRALKVIGDNALALDSLRRNLPHPASPTAQDGRPQRDGKIGPYSVRDIYGKAMNAPNTMVGVTLGSLGHALGEWQHLVDPRVRRPSINHGGNAVQFKDNPAGGVSAITIGNASIFSPDHASLDDVRHEEQHTYQGEQLGPGYLPSNLAGGLTALLFDRDNDRPDWHGPHNWNERGPLSTPPVPWPPRERR